MLLLEPPGWSTGPSAMPMDRQDRPPAADISGRAEAALWGAESLWNNGNEWLMMVGVSLMIMIKDD